LLLIAGGWHRIPVLHLFQSLALLEFFHFFHVLERRINISFGSLFLSFCKFSAYLFA